MYPSPAEPMPYNEIAGAAYRLATDGAVTRPKRWQVDLYRRLSDSTSEAGYLLIAPPGSGKLDSVVIPSLGIRRGGAPRRIFLIAKAGSPLDDFVYRFAPQLRNWAASDGTDRTMYIDGDDTESGSRFYSDGREETGLALNPLEADVDLVLAPFDRFQGLFFGGGGVHALPSALASPAAPVLRRDLFLFNDAHEYTEDGFSRFHKLVEFLFAQDFDVIVVASSMPSAWREELSFLETYEIEASEDEAAALRLLSFNPDENAAPAFLAAARAPHTAGERLIGVFESVPEAVNAHREAVAAAGPSVLLYHEDIPAFERRAIYHSLRSHEKEQEGYTLVTTACALEASDLDASTLVTGFCPPENLLLRAGRLNRRARLAVSHLRIYGDKLPPQTRAMNPMQRKGFKAALAAANGQPFIAEDWLPFI